MNDEAATTPSVKASTQKRATGRALRTWSRRILGALFGLGIVGMLVMAWMPKPVLVDTASVRRGTLRVTVDEDGRTRVKDRFIVSAPLTGNVARLELNPGDEVAQGDVLARVVPLAPPLLDARSRAEAEARLAAAVAQERQARASIERARTSGEFAERTLARQRQLLSSGGTTAAALEEAEMTVRTRREELTSLEFGARVAAHQAQVARAALGRLTERRPAGEEEEQLDVVAPVDGRVLRVIQESSGVVQAGAPLLELGDPAALEIVVDVLTSDAVRVRPGAHVFLRRWGGEGDLAGHVRLVEPSAFTRTSALGVEEQRVNVIIDLDDPLERWQALGDGFRVEAAIVVAEALDVLFVPASAVFRSGDVDAVFTVRDGVAALVEVETGESDGVSTEIRSGLTLDDVVIAHPGDRVSDGIEVAPR